METTTQLNPLTPRTSGSCIASGYRLYTQIFRRLLRASWPVAIVYALAMAALSSYYISHVMPLMGLQTIVDPETMQALWAKTMGGFGALTLCFVVAATVLSGYAFSAMREHLATGDYQKPVHWWGRFDWPTLRRVLITGCWLLVVGIVYSAVLTGLIALAAKSGLTSLTVGAAVMGLVLMCLLLPLCYTSYRAVLAEKFRPAPPFGGYLDGLGHWGLLFVVMLVTGIIAWLLSLVTQLPAAILYAANVQSQLGALQGDELGMPEGMWWLNFVVFAVGGFIQAYVQLSTLFPFYYVYGTIAESSKKTTTT